MGPAEITITSQQLWAQKDERALVPAGAAISTFDLGWTGGVGLADHKEPKSESVLSFLFSLEQFCLLQTYIVRKYYRGYNVMFPVLPIHFFFEIFN